MELQADLITPDDVKLMPPLARELVRLIGLGLTVAAINRFGGINLGIPKGEFNNEHGARAFERLAEVIGEEATRTLCDGFGGERISIPRCHSLRNELRARAIRCAFDCGTNVNDLAQANGMTYRAIENILNRAI